MVAYFACLFTFCNGLIWSRRNDDCFEGPEAI